MINEELSSAMLWCPSMSKNDQRAEKAGNSEQYQCQEQLVNSVMREGFPQICGRSFDLFFI